MPLELPTTLGEGTLGGFEAPRPRRKPPIELDLEVETSDGTTYRLTADAKNPAKRFTALSVSNIRGEGFGPASAVVSREIFRDYPDINLLDTWRAIGRNGDIAWEGRLASDPRTNDPGDTINLQFVGWSSYLKQRKINPLIIDRRLSSWGEPSMARQGKLLSESYRYEAQVNTGWQYRVAGSIVEAYSEESKGPGISLTFQKFDGVYNELGEVWFDSAGQHIGEVRATVERLRGAGDTDFTTKIRLSPDDTRTESDDSADLDYGNTTNAGAEATKGGRVYALLQSVYAGATTGDVNFVIAFLFPRVIGRHGLTKRGTAPGEGFYLTDIAEYVLNTYYPKIDTSEMQTNTYEVTQADWHDNPQDGLSILQQLNDFSLWAVGVWDNRKLQFEPEDLTKADWQIRVGEQYGVVATFDGDTIEGFASGVQVSFEDILTGRKATLLPDDHEELRDETEENAYNRQDEDGWTEYEVPFPCTEAEALQAGRVYLAEFNRPKRHAQFRISGGYIEDSSGQWHPAHAVRSSQTIDVLDHPNDEPRLIHQVDYDDESKTLTVTVDGPDPRLPALIARITNALEAKNL